VFVGGAAVAQRPLQRLCSSQLIVLTGEAGQKPPHLSQWFPLRELPKAGGFLATMTSL
jgi:hypothetical protein